MNKKNLIILCGFFAAIASFSESYALKTRSELIEEHCSRLEQSLQDLDKKHREAIVRDFRKELDSSYKNTAISQLADQIEMVGLTVISTYVHTKAELKARKLCSDPQVIQDFANGVYAQCLDSLAENKSISHLLGKPLEKAAMKQCGVSPSDKIYQQMKIQESHYAQPYQPQLCAPVMPAPVHYNGQQRQALYYVHSVGEKQRITQASKEIEAILPVLFKAGMSARNQTRLEGYFYRSVQKNSAIPVVPPLPHLHNAFLALFEYELTSLKVKLVQEINPIVLEKAIEITRKELSVSINKLTRQSTDQFQRILHNLEDTIIKNAGISCSICSLTYKDVDSFGCAEKVTLTSLPTSLQQRKQCHTICKACAKNGALNSCPECRNTIDQQDLRAQANQPDNPANWRSQ
jgi:hypothetical protein